MRIKTYVHSDKETNYEVGKEAGLTGEALKNFSYAGYELELEFDVDPNTGESLLLSVDGTYLAGLAGTR